MDEYIETRTFKYACLTIRLSYIDIEKELFKTMIKNYIKNIWL